jgi:hypothetical protein
VEEVVQHAIDEEVVQEQASTAGQRPILLGMSTSMSQLHSADGATQEAFPSAAIEAQEAAVETRAGTNRASFDRHEDQMSPDGRDEKPEDGVARQDTVANVVEEQPEEHGASASASTFVSSLHVSSVAQSDGRTCRRDVSPVKNGEQEGSAESDILSSLAWGQGE